LRPSRWQNPASAFAGKVTDNETIETIGDIRRKNSFAIK
jgi:hypothetical protein